MGAGPHLPVGKSEIEMAWQIAARPVQSRKDEIA